ncbi:hypothetical protein ACFYKX_05605 [Cytobacillus sp. FJAT-54145]|uniref:Lipoprotein n=1 Tax=Cytobacillus spartinae TaxID=3299023 RepID=A0ABW6KAZ7_9BACI
MLKKWFCLIFIGCFVSLYLTGCNLGNNDTFEPEEIHYTPVRYNPVNNINDDNNLRGGDLELAPTNVKAPGEADTSIPMNEVKPEFDEEESVEH